MGFSKILKFGLFVWIWWIGTILVSGTAGVLACYLFGIVPAICVFAGLLIYGTVNSVLCTKSFIKNLDMYMRVRASFIAHEDNIKKSILYQMQHYRCTNIMAKDLAHEFQVQL